MPRRHAIHVVGRERWFIDALYALPLPFLSSAGRGGLSTRCMPFRFPFCRRPGEVVYRRAVCPSASLFVVGRERPFGNEIEHQDPDARFQK